MGIKSYIVCLFFLPIVLMGQSYQSTVNNIRTSGVPVPLQTNALNPMLQRGLVENLKNKITQKQAFKEQRTAALAVGIGMDTTYTDSLWVTVDSAVVDTVYGKFYGYDGTNAYYNRTYATTATIQTGASTLKAAPYSLSGSGMKVMIMDGNAIDSDHPELTNSTIVYMNTQSDNPRYIGHANHCANIFCGSGDDTDAIGSAIGTTIYSGGFYTNYTDYSNYINTTIIGSNSWGSSAYYREEWDQLFFDNPEHIPVFAAGNDGPTMATIGSPGTSKNCITVGALNKDTTLATYSSRGPACGVRLKPDICGFGSNIYSYWGQEGETYVYANGTSMATPNVSGGLALIARHIRNKGYTCRAYVMKALIAATAVDLGETGPDYYYGFGLLDALKAVRFIDTSYNDSFFNIVDAVYSGDSIIYNVKFTNTAKVVLSWQDPATSADLVRDLDVIVYEVNGTSVTDVTEAFKPGAAVTSAWVEGNNTTDNIEMVHVPSPSGNCYQVVVKGKGTGYTTAYGLVMTSCVPVTSGCVVQSPPPPGNSNPWRPCSSRYYIYP